MNDYPTIERLRELFSYDAETGKLLVAGLRLLLAFIRTMVEPLRSLDRVLEAPPAKPTLANGLCPSPPPLHIM
jgi:hypothetical protein